MRKGEAKKVPNFAQTVKKRLARNLAPAVGGQRPHSE